MRRLPALPLVTLMLACGAAASAAEGQGAQLVRHFLTSVTDPEVRPADRGAAHVHPAIGLVVANRTTRTLWISVGLEPGPDRRPCAHSLRVEPGREMETGCAQDTILAGATYAVSLVASPDSALVDTVQRTSVAIRFDEAVVRRHQRALAVQRQETERGRLPQSFSSFQRDGWLRSRSGTLIVETSGVRYVTRSDSLLIPIARLRGVALATHPRGDHELVIQHEERGRERELRLRAPRSWSDRFKAMFFAGGAAAMPPRLAAAHDAIERALEQADTPRAASRPARWTDAFFGTESPVKPAHAPPVTYPTPARRGWTTTAAHALAFIHTPEDTTSEDPSSGLGMESSLGVGRFVNPHLAFAVHLAETWTIGNSELVFVPLTLNLTGGVEAQVWPDDHWCFAAGYGAGRYMTMGDAPRSGPAAHARVGYSPGSTRDGYLSFTLDVFPCFYPERRIIGFGIGMQRQQVRP